MSWSVLITVNQSTLTSLSFELVTKTKSVLSWFSPKTVHSNNVVSASVK